MTTPAPHRVEKAITREEMKDLIREGVREALSDIGLGHDNNESREIIRDDMRFLRTLRNSTNRVSAAVVNGLVIAALGGILAAIWTGLQLKMGGK